MPLAHLKSAAVATRPESAVGSTWQSSFVAMAVTRWKSATTEGAEEGVG